MKLSEYLDETGESQAAFGLRAAGVTQSAVGQWLAGGTMRAEHVLKVATATDFRVTPHELRPDLYPHPEDALPKAAGSAAPAAAREAA